MLSSVDVPGPFWGAFTVLRDGLERLIAVNLVWSLQLVPALVGLAFADLPFVLRSVLVGVSVVASPPATLVVYALARQACEGDALHLENVKDAYRALTLASFRTLAPLWGLVGGLVWAAWAAPSALDAPLRLSLLLLGVLAGLWGPILVDAPQLSPWGLLGRSASLWRRYPLHALGLAAASFVTLVVTAVSVGGVFLIAMVLLALFQTLFYISLGERGSGGARRS